MDNNSDEIKKLDEEIKILEDKKMKYDKYQDHNIQLNYIDENIKNKQTKLSTLLEDNKNYFEKLNLPTYSVDAIIEEYYSVNSYIDGELNNLNDRINQISYDKKVLIINLE